MHIQQLISAFLRFHCFRRGFAYLLWAIRQGWWHWMASWPQHKNSSQLRFHCFRRWASRWSRCRKSKAHFQRTRMWCEESCSTISSFQQRFPNGRWPRIWTRRTSSSKRDYLILWLILLLDGNARRWSTMVRKWRLESNGCLCLPRRSTKFCWRLGRLEFCWILPTKWWWKRLFW